MNLQTIIVTPDNWVLGTCDIKDVLIWSMKDRPWLNLRTYNIKNQLTFPCQIKSNSWVDVEITDNLPAPAVRIEALMINARIALFTDLHTRLRLNIENQGLSDVNSTVLDFFNYLGAKGLVESEFTEESKINFENKIRLLQDLYNIRDSAIKIILSSKSKEDFAAARVEIERLFFTNILL